MIKGVLIDLSGTIHQGGSPIPGAVEAVRALQRAGIPFRFVSNTSRTTRAVLHRELLDFGLEVPSGHLFTAPLAVRRHLEEEGLRPFLLIHPDLSPDFAGLARDDPNAVVVGFAREAFTYGAMNEAFRLLKRGAPLLTTGDTRYFQGADGLDLDSGPFVAALEYAAETKATVLGKPAVRFFHGAVRELGCLPAETVMVGDDAESDAGGALAAGLSAILVRTGKYRPGDEERIGQPGTMVADGVAEALAMVLAGRGGPQAKGRLLRR